MLPLSLSLLISRVRFAWSHRKWHLLIVALGSGLALWSAVVWQDPANDGLWTILSRVVTAATLFVAVFVWIGEVSEEWERRLPRRLFVYFQHEGSTTGACLGAALAAESDARALGQQIGAQMVEHVQKQLAFDASQVRLESLRPVVSRSDSQESFKPILVVFPMKTLDCMRDWGLESGQSLVWVAGEKVRRKVSGSDPICRLPGKQLSPDVLRAIGWT
jgi:hypothetical protein